MAQQFIRTQLLIGEEAINRLHQCKVAVFGIGGVGSYAVEALARSGVGNFILVDNDCVSISNINRQIHATFQTIGQWKVEIMKERIESINPKAVVKTYRTFFLPDSEDLMGYDCDYIIDAVDTVTAKIELVMRAKQKGIPIISSMGTGNKLDPSRLKITDLYKTTVCPLAKVMRKELKNRGIQNLKVVYSDENPVSCYSMEEQIEQHGENTNKRVTPGSIAFVPSVAGLLMAGEVINYLAEVRNNG